MSSIKKPVISIIMSVYNGDKINYIQECISSISSQTFTDFEVVLIDDGISVIELKKYIRSLTDIEPRIRLFENYKNLGLAFSMNHAIKMARGEYLARMDSDDLMEPNRLQSQIEFLKLHPNVDIVGSFYNEISEKGNVLNKVILPTDHKKMVKMFPRRNPLAHVSVMMKRQFIEKSGLYPLSSYSDEDTLMWLSGIKNGAIMANIPKYLLSVRVSNDFYKRRGGIKKAYRDAKNRCYVIKELGLSKLNYMYVLFRFLFQLNPFTKLTSLGYKYFR